MAEQFEVITPGGKVFKGWYWKAENATYNLNVITGMDEYALRYDRFAQWMTQRGVHVWVLDAAGQGLNAESVEKQEIWEEDSFNDTVKAIHAMNLMSKKNGLPVVQMGHSMGSFMTQSLIQHYPAATDKVILMGSNGGQPSLMKTAYGLSKVIVNKKNWDKPRNTLTVLGLGAYTKAVKDRKTPVDWLSYNEENVRKYIDDPWCGHPNTGGFWRVFLRSMAGLWTEESMKRISSEEKILLISGEDDPVGQNGKGIRWLKDAYEKRGAAVKMILYPHMRHEILNEDDHERVCRDLLSFITE